MIIYVCLNNYTMTCKERHYISGWFSFPFISMDLQFMGLLLQTLWTCTNCVFQNACKKVCKTFCSSWKQRKIPCLHLHYTSKSHGRPWGTLTNFTFGEGRGGSRCNKWASRHVCAKCPDPHICPASQNRPGGRGFASGGGSTILWNSSLSIQRYSITLSLSTTTDRLLQKLKIDTLHGWLSIEKVDRINQTNKWMNQSSYNTYH